MTGRVNKHFIIAIVVMSLTKDDTEKFTSRNDITNINDDIFFSLQHIGPFLYYSNINRHSTVVPSFANALETCFFNLNTAVIGD